MLILGGSDGAPSRLPASVRNHHALGGYKGAAIQVHGKPLIACLAERLRARPEIGAIWIVGPAAVYAPLEVADRIVDTDADLAGNLRAALDAVLARAEEGPVAFLSCDVLPEVAELERVFALYREDAATAALWNPVVRVPDDPATLQAFAWKPEYRLRPEPGAEPVRVLPGHLVVVEPRALRLDLIYRLLGVAYRTRNRPIERRRGPLARGVLGQLLIMDLRRLARLRLPNVTVGGLRRGLRLLRRLRAGTLTRPELERLGSETCLSERWRREHPERGMRFPLVDALGLAEDVDTEEEARELVRRDAR